ncbi:serine/arginine repetitive matrix protein 1-like [Ixodes scapularis]
MASRRYQPGDRLLGREPGDARRRWESDGYEYDIFPQLPPREAHPPKRWRYQEQDSPSTLSEAGWEAEDASRRPSQPKQTSFWSTPSSRKPATPRGSAARLSEARSVRAEREPSESSKRADVPEASTSGVGRRPSTPRSLMASRRYQPGDRLLGSEPGDAQRRREPDCYEYDIFPQLPPREAHPPKRWQYQEQDSPSLLSEASWEAEDSSRQPSQPKAASFWSTPSSRKLATPKGSAARSSEARSVHAEREHSESSKRETFPRRRLRALVAVPRPRGVSAQGRRRNDLRRRDKNRLRRLPGTTRGPQCLRPASSAVLQGPNPRQKDVRRPRRTKLPHGHRRRHAELQSHRHRSLRHQRDPAGGESLPLPGGAIGGRSIAPHPG